MLTNMFSELGGYVADPHLHIVDSLQTTDMILLYHDVTCTHSITEVHPTTPEVGTAKT